MVTLIFYPNRHPSYLDNRQQEIKKDQRYYASNLFPPVAEDELYISSTVKNDALKIEQWVNHDSVIIVGNGQSAKAFNPPADVPVIAVNSAVQWLNRWDWFFTLNANEKNLNNFQTALKAKNRKSFKESKVVIALPNAIVKANAEQYPQAYVMTRLVGSYSAEPKDQQSIEWLLWHYKAKLGLTQEQGGISTGNSAYGALNLALHLGFKNAILIGVDGTQTPGIDESEPSDLRHLPTLFHSATSQLHLINCGLLEGFDHVDFNNWYASIKDQS